MTKRYKSEALAAAHETALGLTEAGVMTTAKCARHPRPQARREPGHVASRARSADEASAERST